MGVFMSPIHLERNLGKVNRIRKIYQMKAVFPWGIISESHTQFRVS
jgi:hypothetical protein